MIQVHPIRVSCRASRRMSCVIHLNRKTMFSLFSQGSQFVRSLADRYTTSTYLSNIYRISVSYVMCRVSCRSYRVVSRVIDVMNILFRESCLMCHVACRASCHMSCVIHVIGKQCVPRFL